MHPSGAWPAALEAMAQRRPMAAGTVLFRNGDPARHVFALVSGQVVLSRVGVAGEDIVIHVAQAGECFAEAALQGGRYHCTAVATGEAEVAAVPAEAMRHRLQEDPAFPLAWAALLATQLRRARAPRRTAVPAQRRRSCAAPAADRRHRPRLHAARDAACPGRGTGPHARGALPHPGRPAQSRAAAARRRHAAPAMNPAELPAVMPAVLPADGGPLSGGSPPCWPWRCCRRARGRSPAR